MTSRDFCYWLQGFFELTRADVTNDPPAFTVEQTQMVERHLALVFVHEIDPSAGGPETQEALSAVHGGAAIGGTGPNGATYRC